MFFSAIKKEDVYELETLFGKIVGVEDGVLIYAIPQWLIELGEYVTKRDQVPKVV